MGRGRALLASNTPGRMGRVAIIGCRYYKEIKCCLAIEETTKKRFQRLPWVP
jgi:hypothetical protein